MVYKTTRYSKASYASIAVILAIMGSIGYGAYRRFVISGLRAEAHLIASYVSTLETAYFSEYSSYVAFSAYGADHLGVTQCEQPKGAEVLGFSIGWCAGVPNTVPVRFFYQTVLNPDPEAPLEVVATSGSDRQGRSFVCFGNKETDIWSKGPRGRILHLENCTTKPGAFTANDKKAASDP